MRFLMPNYLCEFEIRDAWLREAGMVGFTPSSSAYRSSTAATLVPLRVLLQSPRRSAMERRDRGRRAMSDFKGRHFGGEMVRHPRRDEGLDAADLRSRLRNLIAPLETERNSTRVAEISSWSFDSSNAVTKCRRLVYIRPILASLPRERVRCVPGMLNSSEVKVLYPT
jgi:hypothetical protein